MVRRDASCCASSRVVICGGGIIGAATAYYLSRLGVPSTIVERDAVAGAASGEPLAVWRARALCRALHRAGTGLACLHIEEEAQWQWHALNQCGWQCARAMRSP